MPTSYPKQLSKIIEIIRIIDPQKLIDVGVGFGKYGFLSREYLEYWNGNNDYKKWTRRIDGIEIFKEYLTPVHEFIYDNIYIGNAKDLIPTLDTKYDLMLMIDVLEHFTYEDGIKLLKECKKVSKNILISSPKDIGEQGTCFDNPNEKHEFQWLPKHLNMFETVIIPDELSYIICIGDSLHELKSKFRIAKKNSLKENIKTNVKVRLPFILKFYRLLRN